MDLTPVVKKARGGARPGSGRKPGVSTSKRAQAMNRAIEAGILTDELSPIDVMLKVMRGAKEEEISDRQYVAAVDVAPYVVPKLTAIDARILTAEVKLSEDERKQRIGELLTKLGYAAGPLITSE